MYSEGLNSLVSSLQKYYWYSSAEFDNLGRFVVYVHSMDLNTITKVPDLIDGKRVLFHFAVSKKDIEFLDDADVILDEPDLNILALELEHLESEYGNNNVSSIFYEIVDGKNSVTNLSAKLTKLRDAMDDLYKTYGFDPIYEMIDDCD